MLFFFGSLFGHWTLAWLAYRDEQNIHGAPIVIKEFFIEVGRDTLENWQSEFLQLVWQVAGLAILWCVGSPQSKEAQERTEEKLDGILRMLDPEKAAALLAQLDAKYPKK